MSAFLLVVVGKISSDGPSTISCSASKYAAPYRTDHPPSSAVSSWSALICYPWVCHSDWQEQIFAEAVDAGEPGAVRPNALEFDAMKLDTEELDAL
jgi:hypothetical protein